MEDILNSLGLLGIVPVVAIEDAKDAVPLGRALIAGGLPCAEITFRTAAAEETIKRISAEFPEMLVGAGTVLTVDQVKQAVAAGAKFIVSPGLDPAVIKYCVDNRIPITPGISSPTDVQAALALGLKVLKFFPAESLGGLDMLTAIAAPFGMCRFIPTGGVTTANLLGYLSFPKVLACGGSWMVKTDLIRDGRFDEIERLTKEAVLAMLGLSLGHIGLNTADEAEGVALVKRLCALFEFPLKEGNTANFAGTAFEVMKGQGRGTKGHIAIATNSIPRAMAYLERKGLEFDKAAAKEVNGVIQAVFFKDEIAGFAFHLLQKK